MGLYTLSSIPRLSPSELSEILLADTWGVSNVDASVPSSKIAIVDVRDADHIGGHIRHSIHAPSETIEEKMPELVHDLKDKELVVFHCLLSQQRGPTAAVRYNVEREKYIAKYKGQNSDQQIYVLDKGFTGWANAFGRDPRLSVNMRREIWGPSVC